MSITVGPSIVGGTTSTSLIYHFDPANTKSFPTQENLYPYSEQLSSSAWINSPTQFTINYTTSTGGPYNGSYALATCTTSSAFSSYFFDFGNTVSLNVGDIVTLTWHVNPITTSNSAINTIGLRYWSGTGRAWLNSYLATFRLGTGTGVVSVTGPSTGSQYTTATISVLDNGWYRLSYTAMADTSGYSAISLYNITSSIGGQIVFGAMQLEKNTAFTKYTPTYGSTVSQTTSVYDLSKSYGASSAVNKLQYSSLYSGVLSCTSATTSGYINTPIRGDTTFTVTSTFTISAWFLANDYVSTVFNSAGGTIVGAFNYDGYGIGWRTAGSSSTILVESQMRTSGGGALSGGARATYTAQLNTWNNYTYTYDWPNLAGSLYVNGVYQLGFTIPSNANTGTYSNIINQSISIGSNFASGGPSGYNAPGLIGPVSIWNRVLSPAEVQQTFNAFRGRYGL